MRCVLSVPQSKAPNKLNVPKILKASLGAFGNPIWPFAFGRAKQVMTMHAWFWSGEDLTGRNVTIREKEN
ncbi:hypothetical protein VNO80_29645 [Phaseolus coccineus]|uniref:Uncharacterized protein n=1 Tax=Phaseolus coccineus TaxID=3886 RepID=A0AAN9LES4_PHACN